MGWTHFLQIREKTYKKVVQAFYCQATAYSEKSLIISTIKGKQISLTPDLIAEYLNLPSDGFCVYGDNWDLDLKVNLTDVFSYIFKNPNNVFVSANLHYIPKMLNLLSQHSLIPRKGNHGKITKNDLLIIYCMFYEVRLNLPHVILHHMISAIKDKNPRHGLPYGMILTRLFREIGIDLDGEESEWIISKFRAKNVSHMKSEAEHTLTPSKRKRDQDEDYVSDSESDSPQDPPQDPPQNPPQNLPKNPPIPPQNRSAEHSPNRSQQRSPVLEEHQDLLEDFGNQTAIFNDIQATQILQSFKSNLPPPTKVSNTSQLFTSPPQADFSPLFNSNSISKFFNSLPQFDGSNPLESFTTLQSNCPTMPSNPSKAAPSTSTHAAATDERPPKRSRIEKDLSKIKKYLRRLLEGQQACLSHHVYNKMENQTQRGWISNTLSTRYCVPPPAELPFPPPQYFIPAPSDDSSSDDSSPTPKK
jgi:hypothetical protein